MENLPLTPYSNRGFNAQFLSMERQSPLLDIRTLFRHSEEMTLDYRDVKLPSESRKYFAKILEYPDGSYDIVSADHRVFGSESQPSGKSSAEKKQRKATDEEAQEVEEKQPKETDLERARRRARAKVRQLALANDFKWFVTLTIDPAKIDSYDASAVTRRLNQWLSNKVRRNGLKYVLVPEKHKSGRIHYHGFFNDALPAVYSNHDDQNGHPIYNLPAWIYGFTTAIELYGDRHSAVGYVCKYIGKESEKIGGRWYLSGGDLQQPVEQYIDLPCRELLELQDEEFQAAYGSGWLKATPIGMFAGINGMNSPDVNMSNKTDLMIGE